MRISGTLARHGARRFNHSADDGFPCGSGLLFRLCALLCARVCCGGSELPTCLSDPLLASAIFSDDDAIDLGKDVVGHAVRVYRRDHRAVLDAYYKGQIVEQNE